GGLRGARRGVPANLRWRMAAMGGWGLGPDAALAIRRRWRRLREPGLPRARPRRRVPLALARGPHRPLARRRVRDGRAYISRRRLPRRGVERDRRVLRLLAARVGGYGAPTMA